MMKTSLLFLLSTCLYVSDVYSHGTPIQIDVVDDYRLAVSHPMDQEFAPPIVGQDDENDDFLTITSLTSLGSVVLWDKPGIEIYGMDDESLSIEILARPVIGSPTAEKRALWYWNPVTENVEQSPREFHLLGTSMRSLTILPDQSTSSSFLIANSVAGQTGFHNHGLLNYALDNNNTAPPGIYGFFVRFTSNGPDPSDPFLLVFNFFTDYESLIPASLAIHTAGTLAGDYDLDDDVDGRDFLVWQSLFDSTTRTVADASLSGVVDAADLQFWQQQYGELLGNSTLLATQQLPEPGAISIAVLALICLASHERKRLEY